MDTSTRSRPRTSGCACFRPTPLPRTRIRVGATSLPGKRARPGARLCWRSSRWPCCSVAGGGRQRGGASMRATFIATFGLAGIVAGCGESKPDTTCKGPGTICTWAGTGERAFNGDGLPLDETAFYWPMDVEFAPDGRGYVLDWNNHRVRQVGADGRLKTVIGTDYVGDGPYDQSDLRPEGAAGNTVELNHPTDIQFLPDGTLLLAAW